MRIISVIIVLLTFGSISLQISSCTKEKVPLPVLKSDCPDTIGFQSFVEPLIATNCSTSGCHDLSGAGGYTFIGHAQISTNAERILSTIRHESGFSPMPQGSQKLADTIASQFNCWIVQGKLNN